jgi:RimJ/RimL family protein N-acetyltransferase
MAVSRIRAVAAGHTLRAVPDVRLRTQIDDDEDVLYRIWSDLDTWEERSSWPPAPLPLAEFRQRIASGGLKGDADFVVTLDGAAVGRCTIFNEDALARHAELGIGLLPEARGLGVGTEALRQLVEFGFVRRNLRRLHLAVLASNAAGQAAYRKVGFVEEGRRREHCWVRGRYEDEVLMALLRSDWAAR